MTKARGIGVFACVALIAAAATAQTVVDAETALTAAQRWISQSEVFRAAASGGESFSAVEAEPITSDPARSNMAYHVLLEPRGYIIIAGDRRISPVICFSLTSDLDLSAVPDNALRSMLYEDLSGTWQALDAAEGVTPLLAGDPLLTITAEHETEWDLLLDPPPRKLASSVTNVLVAPMLNTRWSQWNHYNELCPPDPAPGSGYDLKAPVGCVAAAGAQVMKYHEWPAYGWGAASYTDTTAYVTGFQSAVFSDTFDWANMLTNYGAYTSYPSNQEYAVAELMYDVAVACEMDFGSFSNNGGSSASMMDLWTALHTHFYFELGSYSLRATNAATFDEKLRQEIFAGRPTPCSMTNNTTGAGHGVVMDGLSSDAGTNFFHVNYGWGGQNDGWYQPSDINTSTVMNAVFGAQPRFMPLLQAFAGTNLTGVITNQWTFPQRRLGQVARYRLREGSWAATNYIDVGDQYTRWWNVDGLWSNRPSGGNPGACYFKQATGLAASLVSEPFLPSSNTVLRFNYKATLYAERFYTEFTTNAGESWTVLLDRTGSATGYANGWAYTNFSFGAYAGSEVRVRFRYAIGAYWSGDYGVFLDNISISNALMISWTVLTTNIASNATSYAVTGHADGRFCFAVEASDGTNWGPSPPPQWVAVDTAGDADADGIPNSWEYLYFGDATGVTAAADADNDQMSNWAEYRAGTDPTNETSIFTADPERITNGFVVVWPSITDRTYALWRGTNLVPGVFDRLATNLAATPAMNTYTDLTATGEGPYLYRVQVEP